MAWKALQCLSLAFAPQHLAKPFSAVALCFFAATVHAQRDDRPLPELPSAIAQKQVFSAKQHIVSAAHPLAAEAGNKILNDGGSAIDAAIAVHAVLGLIEPQSAGLGGGAFMLLYDANAKKVSAWDGREAAPAGATPELFLDKDGKPMRFADAVVGGRSVGVPGVVRLMAESHAKHGKLKWAQLFESAIELAEKGFPLAPRLHVHLVNDRIVKNDPAAKSIYFEADGAPKSIGTLLKNPAYAETLRAIAKNGADAFYTGAVAEDMVKAVNGHANAGSLSKNDLSNYKVRVSDALCGPYRQYSVCGMPPPSAGGIAQIQVLGMLERHDLPKMRPLSAEAVHVVAEAQRLAYADRERYAADDKYADVPVAGLIDREYIKQRGDQVRLDKSMGVALAGTPKGIKAAALEGDHYPSTGTTHFSIADQWGNIVAVTSSVESVFGSRLFVRGFFLNNQLTDFSLAPTKDGVAVANAVAAGKRPRSSMSPTIVMDKDGNPVLAVGSALGSVIINFVTKTLVATLDWKMDIQAAISLPHFGSRNGPTEVEAGTEAEKAIPGLKALGHEVRAVTLPSGLHGIMRTADGWQGGADPRRDGAVAGK
jgi:gamma-glutamyltranspeptidase/glutathione hydrolase